MKAPVMKFGTRLMVAGALALTTPAAAAPAGTLDAGDDSVIVECVALAAVLNASQPLNGSSASMPQNPLGPLQCWPKDKDNGPIQ